MLAAFKDWFHLHYVLLKDFATPTLALFGFITTTCFAIAGLRTFGKWKREKLEETRMDVAVEGLALAYESVIILDEIRSPLRSSWEWAKMADEGDREELRNKRGSYWAVLKRIDDRKDFFERLWKLQPRFMAVFGPETEALFAKFHSARVRIEHSVATLIDDAPIEHDPSNQELREFYKQLRIDQSCSRGQAGRDGDEVGKMVLEFRNGIEALARPIVDRKFKPRRGFFNRWFGQKPKSP